MCVCVCVCVYVMCACVRAEVNIIASLIVVCSFLYMYIEDCVV